MQVGDTWAPAGTEIDSIRLAWRRGDQPRGVHTQVGEGENGRPSCCAHAVALHAPCRLQVGCPSWPALIGHYYQEKRQLHGWLDCLCILLCAAKLLQEWALPVDTAVWAVGELAPAGDSRQLQTVEPSAGQPRSPVAAAAAAAGAAGKVCA